MCTWRAALGAVTDAGMRGSAAVSSEPIGEAHALQHTLRVHCLGERTRARAAFCRLLKRSSCQRGDSLRGCVSSKWLVQPQRSRRGSRCVGVRARGPGADVMRV